MQCAAVVGLGIQTTICYVSLFQQLSKKGSREQQESSLCFLTFDAWLFRYE